MSDAFQDLGKMVPGFDFLQSLMKNANAAMPNFGQWVAPTLDPAELEKRIAELRTVQFWLEQNARMIGTTIQAMEVQRMTLSTLQTMNVPMDALREAMTIPPQAASAAASFFTPPQAAAPAAATPAAPAAAPAAAEAPAAATPPGSAPPMVDPMQWWGALSQQFSALAAQAMQDPGAQAAAQAATRFAGDLVKQSFSTAEQALRQGLAATMPAPPPEEAAGTPAPAEAGPEAARKRAAPRKATAAAKSATRPPKA
ncbi:PhaM family polyhydroxyalkanoate granule multifunctional regulatory protein [Caldimonas tepidiphila]|uniref:PhaM family polyhydroxyalkanoate granule multifunctional regulatory protein n=1 Tax=Caldimonas tepidiphila TaxID=2315841 RepID=UPI000E5C133A|nr:PhaM family polyhydroxyalkanoate granule multifunctional regulatory protein [Caldimonas tepidiphila]